MKNYEGHSSRFIKNHIDFVIEKIKEYLRQSPMDIITKGSCSEGGCETSDVDLEEQEFLFNKGSLDKSQMDKFFMDLTSGSREPVPKFAGNILWDGPWIFGEPVGVPNEVLFYHQDIDLDPLSEIQRNQQWKFKVSGEDWDLTRSTPVLDEDTLICGNNQVESEGDVIDLEKLPAYFKRHAYHSKMVYKNGHEYSGDWVAGKWHGKGCLKFPAGSEVKSIHAVWSQSGVEGDVHIQFAQLAGDKRATYHGAVLFDNETCTVQPHGSGTMEFSDQATLKEWEWIFGKAVVDSAEAATKILKYKWLVDLPSERLYFKHLNTIEVAMAELKDVAWSVQEQLLPKDRYEAVECKLKRLSAEGRALGEILNFDELLAKCSEADHLIQTIRDEQYIFQILILLGNPGVGKSSFGSGLVGGGFKSGHNYGTGLTKFFSAINKGGLVVLDTPGLADLKIAEQAAQEVTAALKKGGKKAVYRIIMMLTLEGGRLRPDDILTLKNVLEALPDEVEMTPGVIVNKVDADHMCPSEEDWLSLCQGLFSSPQTRKYLNTRAQWLFIESDTALHGKANCTLAPRGSREWVFALPTCMLDSDLVTDVRAVNAEAIAEMTEQLKILMEDKEARENELQALQEELRIKSELLAGLQGKVAKADAVMNVRVEEQQKKCHKLLYDAINYDMTIEAIGDGPGLHLAEENRDKVRRELEKEEAVLKKMKGEIDEQHQEAD